ncbi:MAG: hypothetical protein WBM08_08115 [Prochlorococcaceae cyanobacterium]
MIPGPVAAVPGSTEAAKHEATEREVREGIALGLLLRHLTPALLLLLLPVLDGGVETGFLLAGGGVRGAGGLAVGSEVLRRDDCLHDLNAFRSGYGYLAERRPDFFCDRQADFCSFSSRSRAF